MKSLQTFVFKLFENVLEFLEEKFGQKSRKIKYEFVGGSDGKRIYQKT